jgi:DNA polymerase III epsilon subunit family exonuclease
MLADRTYVRFDALVQLALDGLDRLVAALEEQGPLPAAKAARFLFASRSIPAGLACTLLREVCGGDSRIVCADATVSLASAPDPLLEEAEFVVFDLETTGLSAQTSRICELGAVRVRALGLVDSFQSLVDPGVPLPQPVARLTGLHERDLRGAPPVETVVGRFLSFAGYTPLVAHNARFDQRFLERQLSRRESRRLAEPPLCTAALARRLLAGRQRRVSLSALAHFFGVPTAPCHRALPDAEATAEVLIHLIELAQELGARRVSELRTLAAPRQRRVHGKRPLIRGAPTRPGVYLFRDRHDQVLYVGRARDLRARLRSYFQGEAQRPSVEAALLALERIEWRVLGSELEAALEELRLIRELQPPANSRSRQQNRSVYLRRRGEEFVVTKTPTRLGPIGSRRQATLAARALARATPEELEQLLADGPLPRLRQHLAHLSENLRYEEAARLRDRLEALEHVLERLRRLEHLRELDVCVIAPALTPGWRQAFFVCAGVLCAVRPLPPGPGARLEINAGLTIARHTAREREPLTGEEAENMLLLGSFVHRPPPELTVIPLDSKHLAGQRLAIDTVSSVLLESSAEILGPDF